MLPVGQVIEIVQAWVDREARHWPNFAGAYLWGGITALPDAAPFRLFRDVDVVVVLTEGAQDDNEEVSYRGLLLEVITKNLDEHRDVEATLANPSAGPNLATTRILADPTGSLTPFQSACAAGYVQPRFIQARCAAEKAAAEAALTAMRRAATPAERLDGIRDFLAGLSGLLAVAQLKRPTTRRTLTLLGELLDAQGRPDLHEAALAVMGAERITREEVETMLDRFATAYGRAAEVYRTPIPYGFALHPYVLPYMVDGARELIEEGSHREAVYWITCMDTAYLALANDAPEAEKAGFAAELQGSYVELGLTAPAAAWAERVALAEQLARETYALADALAAQYPAERYDD